MHTFIVWAALDQVPEIVSLAGRKKAAQDVKERIGVKAFSDKKDSAVSKSLVTRVNDLCEGKVFERVNFEQIKKEKDAAAKEAEAKNKDADAKEAEANKTE